MYQGKPVIGLAGGIGSGKSFVAELFGELGCRVISSDELVGQAYRDEQVRSALRDRWGEEVFPGGGGLDREKLADKVFGDPHAKQFLERVLHPWVDRRRQEIMAAEAHDPHLAAFVWDTPLLFEAGLHGRCDKVIFVEAPFQTRFQRVRRSRGWDQQELTRREKLQWPLDRKREMSDYTIRNSADAASARRQVAEVLSRIRAELSLTPPCDTKE